MVPGDQVGGEEQPGEKGPTPVGDGARAVTVAFPGGQQDQQRQGVDAAEHRRG